VNWVRRLVLIICNIVLYCIFVKAYASTNSNNNGDIENDEVQQKVMRMMTTVSYWRIKML